MEKDGNRRVKPTKEYLEKQDINPDYCFLYWLAGYTEEEWIKIPAEEKERHAKEWNRKPPKYHGSIRAEDTDTLRFPDLRESQDQEDEEIFRERYR